MQDWKEYLNTIMIINVVKLSLLYIDYVAALLQTEVS